MVRAVVLAAGASSRMGAPKAGLAIGRYGDTFLSRILKQLTDAGLPDIVVVTGAHPDAVWQAAGRVRRPVRFEHNLRWTEGQVTSLTTAMSERHGDFLEALLVVLVDAPFVSVPTIRQVLGVWRSRRPPIVRPSRGELHGHPVIFDRAVFAELRAADPAIGAKAVVRAHAADLVNVPVEDEGAFRDIDTPADYRAAMGGLSSSANQS